MWVPPQGGRGALKGHEAVVEEAVVEEAVVEEAVEPPPGPPEPPPGPSEPNTCLLYTSPSPRDRG